MNTDVFASRHIGIRKEDFQPMLKMLNVENLEQLIFETIPEDIRLEKPLHLDPPMSEHEFLNHIQN